MPEAQCTVSWRSVPQFPGYMVSDTGEVWSLWRRGPSGLIGLTWRKLTPRTIHAGRFAVTLMPGRVQIQLHTLVLRVWKGPCPEGMEACHYPDTDPSNCHASNLRWDTHANNIADAVRHGRMTRGINMHSARFTEDDIRAIRLKFDSGLATTYELADDYKVRQGTIWYIVARKTWKHVSP